MFWIKISKFILISVLLINSSVIASDVRLAGMGGGSIALEDFENDVFLSAAQLMQLKETVIFCGFAARTTKWSYYDGEVDSNGVYHEIGLITHTYKANNPSLGAIFPLNKSGTNAAFAVGGDFQDGPWLRQQSYQINLRLGQKLGTMGFGLGYDALFVGEKIYKDFSYSVIFTGNDNKIILNHQLMNAGDYYPLSYLTVKWQNWYWKRINWGLYGGVIPNYNHDDAYETGLSVLLNSFSFLNVNLTADALFMWRKMDYAYYYGTSKYDSWYESGLGRIGFEKELNRHFTLRAGISGWGPDVCLVNYHTIYEPEVSYYTLGTTMKFLNHVKIDYAYLSHIYENKYCHYVKASWSY